MNVATWFKSRGLDVSGEDLASELVAEAGISVGPRHEVP
jgi:hypothetical protein